MATKGSGRLRPKAKRRTAPAQDGPTLHYLLHQKQRDLEAQQHANRRLLGQNDVLREHDRLLQSRLIEARRGYRVLEAHSMRREEQLKQAEGDRDLLTQVLHLYTRPRMPWPMLETPQATDRDQELNRLQLADEKARG